jgi:hypothetical protein
LSSGARRQRFRKYLFVVVVVVERATKDVPTVFAAAMNERRLA